MDIKKVKSYFQIDNKKDNFINSYTAFIIQMVKIQNSSFQMTS